MIAEKFLIFINFCFFKGVYNERPHTPPSNILAVELPSFQEAIIKSLKTKKYMEAARHFLEERDKAKMGQISTPSNILFAPMYRTLGRQLPGYGRFKIAKFAKAIDVSQFSVSGRRRIQF